MVESKAVRRILTLLGILALAVAACAAPSEDRATPGAATPELVIPEEAAELVAQVQGDLAERLDATAEETSVVEVNAVEWPDKGLGCPAPGQSYDQVITPGYLIRLSAEGQVYEYHTDMEEILFCDTSSRDEPADGSMEAKVRSDLAQRLGVKEDEITVVSVTPMEWPDSSLGCPQPGMSYLQVITPGLKVVLEALGQEYAYHTGPDTFVLCEEPSTAGPVARQRPTEGTRLDPEVERLVALAMEDLGEWLGVPLDEISLTSVEAVEWRDSSLGCPEPGMAYLTVITPGYLILLEVDGETYEYHTDTNRVVYCEDPQPPLESP